MKPYFHSLFLTSLLSCPTLYGAGAAVTHPGPAAKAGPAVGTRAPALSVNIDDPKFHPVKTALVPLVLETETPNAKILALDCLSELERLLTFTGIFSLQIQSHAMASIEPSLKESWRKIGLEAVIFGKLRYPSPTRLSLELHALDLIENVQVSALDHTYEISASGHDFNAELKDYVDRVLMHFTKRPGIFSSKLAFIGKRHKNDNKQVFICDPDGRNVEQITHAKTLHVSPSWSPDGKKIVYTSFQKNNPDLHLYDRAKKESTVLSNKPGINSGGVFSPNGKLIVFTGSVNENSNFYWTTPHGGNRQPFMPGSGLEVDMAFSPNEKWVAFVSGRFGNPHIFRGTLVWNADMSAVLNVIEQERMTYEGWHNTNPTWSHDSEKIAWCSFDKEVGRFDLFVMNGDEKGTKKTRLTLNQGHNQAPTWSPNDQLIAFSSNHIGNNVMGNNQLYMMNRDGTRRIRIETGLYEAETPRWGPFIAPK